MKTAINFSRQVFNKKEFQDTVDTEFTQLVETPDETFFDPNLAEVEDFFTVYENLFFDIPQFGEANSHEFLIKQSTEYIGLQQQNETIQALLDEITELRQENLKIRQDNLKIVEQFSRGVTSDQAEIIFSGAEILGD